MFIAHPTRGRIPKLEPPLETDEAKLRVIRSLSTYCLLTHEFDTKSPLIWALAAELFSVIDYAPEYCDRNFTGWVSETFPEDQGNDPICRRFFFNYQYGIRQAWHPLIALGLSVKSIQTSGDVSAPCLYQSTLHVCSLVGALEGKELFDTLEQLVEIAPYKADSLCIPAQHFGLGFALEHRERMIEHIFEGVTRVCEKLPANVLDVPRALALAKKIEEVYGGPEILEAEAATHFPPQSSVIRVTRAMCKSEEGVLVSFTALTNRELHLENHQIERCLFQELNSIQQEIALRVVVGKLEELLASPRNEVRDKHLGNLAWLLVLCLRHRMSAKLEEELNHCLAALLRSYHELGGIWQFHNVGDVVECSSSLSALRSLLLEHLQSGLRRIAPKGRPKRRERIVQELQRIFECLKVVVSRPETGEEDHTALLSLLLVRASQLTQHEWKTGHPLNEVLAEICKRVAESQGPCDTRAAMDYLVNVMLTADFGHGHVLAKVLGKAGVPHAVLRVEATSVRDFRRRADHLYVLATLGADATTLCRLNGGAVAC